MNERKKIIFIVNPTSGTTRKKRIVEKIETKTDKGLFDPSIRFTEYAGHATQLAADAVGEGADIVVAVGGDGTINEVARSLVHTDTSLGIIPCGSGNGLARHLHIPLSVNSALHIINTCEIHRLDYGLCDGRPFFCTCGVGFDAFISEKFANHGKRGPISYAEIMLKEGLRYKPELYVIEDEETKLRYKAYVITCANASQYGNNCYIAPHASMKDGLMDVTMISPFGVIGAPGIVIGMFSKTLPRNSKVKTFKTRKILITRDQEGPYHCDGDPYKGGKQIEIEIVPKALNIVVNPEAHSPYRRVKNLLRTVRLKKDFDK
ncbi:diacylglycerol kinase family lipid kinase [Pseudoprevotella muciniphila]|uniref:Diacylglycerol kinase family lipid kinase n=1 Tax=Pseudoprevotella muciniphila TaxID=2133944 RepID=A0A5P8E8Y7_9BACT|nr:diacylglycerol kinase family protein [Pseudoprevotella muciniphila]QFQ13495.1 diacylglycerol kinase family lipid kinase [Pseudoprevotella muciniphila]